MLAFLLSLEDGHVQTFLASTVRQEKGGLDLGDSMQGEAQKKPEYTRVLSRGASEEGPFIVGNPYFWLGGDVAVGGLEPSSLLGPKKPTRGRRALSIC